MITKKFNLLIPFILTYSDICRKERQKQNIELFSTILNDSLLKILFITMLIYNELRKLGELILKTKII